ncbi:MAG: alpha/beta hydrolase [Candidatus Coproplasma sp.]
MARFNLRFTSKALLRKSEVNLIVPSLDLHGALSNKNVRYYRDGEERFPLMILLSGFGDDNEAWIQRTGIVELCDEYRVAAVMLGGENKWYIDASPVDGWHTFICEELPDFLYGNFAKLDENLPLILGGVSMGGYGALYNGLKNPEKFGAIMALSPATKPDDCIDESAIGTLRELFLSAKGKIPQTYLSIGEQDFIIQPTRQLDEWLTENGIGVNYRYVEGYGHSWALWRNEIGNFLRELKNKKII